MTKPKKPVHPVEERRAPDEEQPIALAVAEEAGVLPETDRRAPEPEHGLTVYPIG